MVGTFLQLSYKSIGSYSPLPWRWTSEGLEWTLHDQERTWYNCGQMELELWKVHDNRKCCSCHWYLSKNSSKYWKIIYQTIKWMVRNSRLKKRQWPNRWLQLIRIRRNLGKTLGGVWSTWEQQWGKQWEESWNIIIPTHSDNTFSSRYSSFATWTSL